MKSPTVYRNSGFKKLSVNTSTANAKGVIYESFLFIQIITQEVGKGQHLFSSKPRNRQGLQGVYIMQCKQYYIITHAYVIDLTIEKPLIYQHLSSINNVDMFTCNNVYRKIMLWITFEKFF